MKSVITATFFVCVSQAITALADNDGIHKENRDREMKELARLQGVWEQIGLQDDKGKTEIRSPESFNNLKWIMINSGKTSYRVYSAALGVGVTVMEIHFLQGGAALEFVSPYDNRTIRCLHAIDSGILTACWHGHGKTLRQPVKIAPTPDGFVVCTFKKLISHPPKMNSKDAKKHEAFSGLWDTVEFERDGEKLSTKGDPATRIEFWKNQRVFYFDGNHYTMIKTDDYSLRVVHKSFQVEPNGEKQAIDFVAEDGLPIPAIFTWDAEILVICFNHRGKERPKQFRTAKDDGTALVRLKRVTVEK